MFQAAEAEGIVHPLLCFRIVVYWGDWVLAPSIQGHGTHGKYHVYPEPGQAAH